MRIVNTQFYWSKLNQEKSTPKSVIAQSCSNRTCGKKRLIWCNSQPLGLKKTRLFRVDKSRQIRVEIYLVRDKRARFEAQTLIKYIFYNKLT